MLWAGKQPPKRAVVGDIHYSSVDGKVSIYANGQWVQRTERRSMSDDFWKVPDSYDPLYEAAHAALTDFMDPEVDPEVPNWMITVVVNAVIGVLENEAEQGVWLSIDGEEEGLVNNAPVKLTTATIKTTKPEHVLLTNTDDGMQWQMTDNGWDPRWPTSGP